ncbi:hypothetical protein RF11_09625 [Thelohanellus kitauei]|uniref:Uncharacterized protein n=1 Tax=Thelohanellus kitauei TaxID=669202 RepID=A0A0C2IXX6_THEKT|nr:hypothetical protein RF11_09625 [Thelohanellus kitauei]
MYHDTSRLLTDIYCPFDDNHDNIEVGGCKISFNTQNQSLAHVVHIGYKFKFYKHTNYLIENVELHMKYETTYDFIFSLNNLSLIFNDSNPSCNSQYEKMRIYEIQLDRSKYSDQSSSGGNGCPILMDVSDLIKNQGAPFLGNEANMAGMCITIEKNDKTSEESYTTAEGIDTTDEEIDTTAEETRSSTKRNSWILFMILLTVLITIIAVIYCCKKNKTSILARR